jgi:tetratricopeptide (TPR) repeat protein
LEEITPEVGDVVNAPKTNSEELPIDAGMDLTQNDSDLGELANEVKPITESVGDVDVTQHLAYEAFLQAEEQSQTTIPGCASADMPEQKSLGVQPKSIAMVNESGDFKLEIDAKNAHVWNELGNVYFNRGAVEDAIIAYSKAIELDRLFAWPYSNLALAYVQKGSFAEAMLLYQRSIELFKNDKDKAISWNRLGNVYRRLNDYDNAIAAYQRADELDPDNSTIYLQSRFSLLGSFQIKQDANAIQ